MILIEGLQFTGTKKLKRHNLHDDCMDGSGGEEWRREKLIKHHLPLTASMTKTETGEEESDEERNRRRVSDKERAAKKERDGSITRDGSIARETVRLQAAKSGDHRWGGVIDNIEEKRETDRLRKRREEATFPQANIILPRMGLLRLLQPPNTGPVLWFYFILHLNFFFLV